MGMKNFWIGFAMILFEFFGVVAYLTYINDLVTTDNLIGLIMIGCLISFNLVAFVLMLRGSKE